MGKLLGILLRPIVITVVALILLSLVLYFGLQVLRERGFLSDFWSDGTLLVLCIGVWVIAGAIYAYRRHQANKRAQIIEQRLRAQAQDQVASVRPDRKPEIAALEKQFDEALQSLQTSRLGKRALYALPWYIIVGPPGSGKTTLLKESSLNFPHMGQGGRGVRGVGGTRNCDWWFTDQGILLDTAGRYTTEAEDHDEWLSFLDMLAKARKHKPINGALVAISVQDIVGASDDELIAHSTKIRDRLAELSKELDMVFPIYLVFTKCDLLDGFVETFGSMSREERGQVWGTTLTPELRQGREIQELLGTETDALYERLCANRMAMLAVDRPNTKRQRIYSFPLQFMAVRDRVIEFVRLLAQPNPYYEGAELRGVYYTSGTQEGAPIDRVLSAMSEAFGFEPEAEKAAAADTTMKSYFIDNLFTRVIFRDKDLAHRSAKLRRREEILRKGAFYGSAAALLVAFVMLVISFFGNRGSISDTRALLARAAVLDTVPAGVPSAEQIAVLADLNKSFVALHQSHYFGSILLGRDDQLYAAVRAKYVRTLQELFLVPCQNYLRGDLMARSRAKGKLKGPELTRFTDRIEVFAMIGGEHPPNAELLGQAIREEYLWSWDRDQIGKQRTLGVDRPDTVHLDAFLTIAGGERTDWVVETDPAVLKAAKRHRAISSKSDQAVDDALDQAGSVDPAAEHELHGETKAMSSALGSLARAKKATGATLDRLHGTPEEKATAERKVVEEFTRAWRQFLSSFRPKQAEFRNLTEARRALATYTGEANPYIKVYELARSRLREAGKLTAPRQVGDKELDRQWLATALNEIAGLDKDIGDFLSATQAQARVLPDLTKAQGQTIGALLAACGRARENVGKIVNLSAEPELKQEAATALTSLIGAVEDAFAQEAIVELERHWSDIAGLLQGHKARFPFTADAEEDVSIEEFSALFRRDGKFDAALAPIERLAGMKVGGRPIIELTAGFADDLRRIRQIQAAMFGAGATAKIDFKLTLGVGSFVGEVLLFISDTLEISSKKEPETRKSFGGLACTWAQTDLGAKVQIRVSDEQQSLLTHALEKQAGVPNTPWRFFRVLRAGSPTTAGKTVRCEWSFDYAPAGVAPSKRTAHAELTTAGPNPFIIGFFADFGFPTKVFKAR